MSEDQQWLTVAQASGLSNLSEKTIRKRIKSGEIEAMRVPLERGGSSFRIPKRALTGFIPKSETEVDPESKRKEVESETEPITFPIGSETDISHAQKSETEEALGIETELEPIKAPASSGTKTEAPPPETEGAKMPSVSNEWAQRETDYREEIRFLRGLVEQRDRDAAELRAALRKALEAMPKQLGQGAPSQDLEPHVEPEKAPVEVVPKELLKVTPVVTKSEPRPLWKVVLGLR
jgi:excisionase family DNA binding protein